ncbi:MAU2 chromatid cohesion factor-like protein [Micractinium conductrix]|uniref:MAU2 chromatid cohesion factor-like protein n=1 Tax=Micractinium conductrix TaxID=554055 RepID=A0A2P6VIV6_9CHLO|nr:MAU2 chromatid cohesion factor-like protein [Micractinium conductrix]|eukprot:PSC74019.1 MAU2 chromatid cohesion factor-like protein [Micractinium conductrix]
MKETIAAVLALAEQFAAEGQPAAAVKCLTPLCGDGSGALPAVVSAARLRLANLLLQHFDNVHEAKTVLLLAEQELRQTGGNHPLKCEVWDALARCNQRLGAVAAEQGALAAGLKACRAGATSKDKEVLARWRAYFHFRLAEHSLVHAGPEAASEALAQLESDGALALTAGERALRLLCRATLALTAGDPAAASPLLEQASAAIDEAGSGGPPALHAHLCCHHAVLAVSMAVLAGRISELTLDEQGNIPLLAQLQQLLAGAGGAPWSYHWVSTPAVSTLGQLLHASLLRSLGKGASAAACLAAAAETVAEQLAVLGIDLQGVEGQLGVAAIWEGRIYCQLSVLCQEQRVLAALQACKLTAAAELLQGLTALLGRFPSLLREAVPMTQMLLGHYCHSVGEHGAAAAHFQRVLRSEGAAPLHDGAALAAALAELQGDPEGTTGGQRRAAEALEVRGLRELPHMLGLPVHDRVAALTLSALLALRAGDASSAALMLTRALKTGHGQLGNTQMVAQVLNVMAPVQAAKGDRTGAEQMLGSSLTLAKAAGDLPTLVTAARGQLRMFLDTPGEQERASKQKAYVERKAGDLAGVVAAAAAAPQHAALLAWQPPQG